VHWKEYTDAVNKNQQFNSDELLKTFKYVLFYIDIIKIGIDS